ncbi:MAG: hypothetical protein QM796_13630 [Chthoniobacteraceae bacterium]
MKPFLKQNQPLPVWRGLFLIVLLLALGWSRGHAQVITDGSFDSLIGGIIPTGSVQQPPVIGGGTTMLAVGPWNLSSTGANLTTGPVVSIGATSPSGYGGGNDASISFGVAISGESGLLSQNLTGSLLSGQTYTLDIAVAVGSVLGTLSSTFFTLTSGNTTVAQISSDTILAALSSPNAFQTVSTTFTADNNYSNLLLTISVNATGPQLATTYYFDNPSITAVPEARGLTLALSSGALLLLRWRRLVPAN